MIVVFQFFVEAVCIRLYKPDLCKQKKHVAALRLFS